MNKELLKDIGVGIAFVFSHLLIFQYLPLYGAVVDPLLIYLIWLCLKYDRVKVLFMAAGLSFFQDMLFDQWGINMFSKILTVFLAYRVISRNSETRLMLWQVILFIWAISIVHNGIYLIFTGFINTYTYGHSPIIFLLGSSFYTALFGTILYSLKDKS